MLDPAYVKAKLEHDKAYRERCEANVKRIRLKKELEQKWMENKKLQEELDQLIENNKRDWEFFKERTSFLKDQIGRKNISIEECNKIEESLRSIARSETDPDKALVYERLADSVVAIRESLEYEKSDLVSSKRACLMPDNQVIEAKKENLKAQREIESDLRERYHEARNEFTAKDEAFKRAKEKLEYTKGLRAEKPESSLPKPITLDEDTIIQAGVPRSLVATCITEQRTDGYIDILYGGDGADIHHGHIVMDASHNIIKHRLPSRNNNTIIHT